MSDNKSDKSPDKITLSYSSANLIKNCEMKYYLYKVKGVAKDADSSDNEDAFNVGKAFHWILETNNHTEDRLVELLNAAVKTYEVESYTAMIHAMILRYLQVHYKSGLEVVHCEFAMENDEFLGFIDAIMIDPSNQEWWIVDLKTASRFSTIKAAMMHSDVQLNLYASFAHEIAQHFNLDLDKFAGVRYRTTEKSRLKRKASESYDEFVRRMASSIVSYDIIVRAERLDPQAIYSQHKDLREKALQFHNNEQFPTKNLSYCDAFFRPCEYFSQCHGKTYSELKDSIEMITSDNFKGLE